MSSTIITAEPMKRNFWYFTKVPLCCRNEQPHEVLGLPPAMNRRIDTSTHVFLKKKIVTERTVADSRE